MTNIPTPPRLHTVRVTSSGHQYDDYDWCDEEQGRHDQHMEEDRSHRAELLKKDKECEKDE